MITIIKCWKSSSWHYGISDDFLIKLCFNFLSFCLRSNVLLLRLSASRCPCVWALVVSPWWGVAVHPVPAASHWSVQSAAGLQTAAHTGCRSHTLWVSQSTINSYWEKITLFLGMHDMDFFQPISITDNYLLLTANTDKITVNLTFYFSLFSLFFGLSLVNSLQFSNACWINCSHFLLCQRWLQLPKSPSIHAF